MYFFNTQRCLWFIINYYEKNHKSKLIDTKQHKINSISMIIKYTMTTDLTIISSKKINFTSLVINILLNTLRSEIIKIYVQNHT